MKTVRYTEYICIWLLIVLTHAHTHPNYTPFPLNLHSRYVFSRKGVCCVWDEHTSLSHRPIPHHHTFYVPFCFCHPIEQRGTVYSIQHIAWCHTVSLWGQNLCCKYCIVGNFRWCTILRKWIQTLSKKFSFLWNEYVMLWLHPYQLMATPHIQTEEMTLNDEAKKQAAPMAKSSLRMEASVIMKVSRLPPWARKWLRRIQHCWCRLQQLQSISYRFAGISYI